MAYKLKRNATLIEELELDGGKTLQINANLGRIADGFNKAQNAIIRLQSADPTPENVEKLGDATVGLIRLALGDENTEEILAYYEKDYLEMVEQILPFIQDVFVPAIKVYADQKRADAGTRYKALQKKKFGR